MLATLLGICLTASVCAPDPEPRSGRPLSEDYPGLIGLMLWIHEEHYIITGELYGGRVIALTEDTITVRKWCVARVFRFSPQLTSDRIPLEWSLGTGHRLRDVRVGDRVTMDLAHARDGHVCINIGIWRRPGGVIPPAEDTQLPAKSRLHVRANATQFAEETFAPKWVPWMSVYLR